MSEILGICRKLLEPSVDLNDFETVRRNYGSRDREIPFVPKISVEEFFERFLLPNKACLIGESLTSDWLARRDWVGEDGKPNWPHLRQRYGETKVPVADCEQVEYGSHVKIEMTLNEYLDYWQDDIRTRSDDVAGSRRRILYLKDWHFVRVFKDSPIYHVAAPFQSDWLNEYWDASGTDDYRFVYMGPKGTWTPFHADVFRSYSWSTNICGRKRWLLFPPGEEVAFRDRFGSFPLDVTSDDVKNSGQFPAYEQATQPIVVIQEAGQTIFVPSGWHHQVENLEDTVSINHNWGNACNVVYLWKGLKDDLLEVEKAISDCRDMDDYHTHCQVLLRSHSGLNYPGFLKLILTVGSQRLDKMEKFLQQLGSESNTAGEADRAASTRVMTEQLCCSSERQLKFTGNHWNLFDLTCMRLVLQDVLAQSLSEAFTEQEQPSIMEASELLKTVTNCTLLFLNAHTTPEQCTRT
ncbi:2-oxoglutarate and iron-dependent oxygenase JMJD4-like [Sycon ciliatum]|uniref:2-oxoglutarate and iron-dependent oxygenase JMJD4-like n=1 Tax=Sycon ciliatum TaxID=27933 RepID=UPI0031F60D32|eukprot:scpid23774/ scgid30313/ JmjC domain-containing protein 4; Jumonji domain-containing protein 4